MQQDTFKIEKLLAVTVKKGAADLHIAVGSPPTIRLAQSLQPISNRGVTKKNAEEIFKATTREKQQLTRCSLE